jgi:L-rhamnose mutarotase
MERVCNVWPEMLRAIRNAGWSNYSLFLSDAGLLVGYFETENFEQAVEALAREEINTLWQKEMVPFFVDMGGETADRGMSRLEQVFYIA